MNGFHKSKGIVIELTALLDVILIMLFWVMINTRNNMTNAVNDAENKVTIAEAQLDEAQKELQAVRDEAEAEIADIWAVAESIDQSAAANQEALIGFENGRLITLSIKYDSDGHLYICNYDKAPVKVDISSENDIFYALSESFASSGLNTDDVILCALVYDSKNALYKDVNNVKSAIDRVRNVYKNFYCAYINTSD